MTERGPDLTKFDKAYTAIGRLKREKKHLQFICRFMECRFRLTVDGLQSPLCVARCMYFLSLRMGVRNKATCIDWPKQNKLVSHVVVVALVSNVFFFYNCHTHWLQ